MASLFKNIDKSAQAVAFAMYEAAEKIKKNRSLYLGMSQIGHECDRYLWLNFRGYKPIYPNGRVMMLFRFGDRIEEEVIFYLKSAGYKIEGQQDSFSDFDGLFKGHCDGIIYGVTKEPHILEIKSANDNSFKDFKSKGIKKNIIYIAQAQCYMGYSGLKRTLFVVQNKNSSEIYTERIYFDPDIFYDIREKARKIIESNNMPEYKQCFSCQFCNQKQNCEGDFLMERYCGTCYYFNFINSEKVCFHEDHVVKIKRWGAHCPQWIAMDDKRYDRPKKVSFEEAAKCIL